MSEINLNTPGILKQITAKIKTDIDAHCLTYNDGHRSHLGASLIGHDCKRYLWYTFRWVKNETFDARMNRLFRRGHREEAQFVEMLKGAGFKVWEFNTDAPPKEDGSYPQFRISDCLGHFGGSMDGKIEFPETYGIAGKFLCEFKTNGTGSGFTKLTNFGVVTAKPVHFAQQSIYGYKEGLTHSLYMNVNKNDDELHIEFVKLDHELGKQLIQKAEQVIFTQSPPAKFSLNPTHFTCKFCSKSDICHEGKPAEKNCRSCINAKPVENAEWHCAVFNAVIPKEFIALGCDSWQDITKQTEL